MIDYKDLRIDDVLRLLDVSTMDHDYAEPGELVVVSRLGSDCVFVKNVMGVPAEFSGVAGSEALEVA